MSEAQMALLIATIVGCTLLIIVCLGGWRRLDRIIGVAFFCFVAWWLMNGGKP